LFFGRRVVESIGEVDGGMRLAFLMDREGAVGFVFWGIDRVVRVDIVLEE
jgi:hypothetical protein